MTTTATDPNGNMIQTPFLNSPRTTTPGIRINRSRSSSAMKRTSSATSELRDMNLRGRRPPSNTSYLSGPESPMSPVEDEVFSDEKTALLKARHAEDGEKRASSNSISLSLDDKENLLNKVTRKSSRGWKFWIILAKLCILFVITVMCSVVLVSKPELHDSLHETIADRNDKVVYSHSYDKDNPILHMKVMGPFTSENLTNATDDLYVRLVTQSNQTEWILHINDSAIQHQDVAEFDHEFRCEEPGDCNIFVRLLDLAAVNGTNSTSSLTGVPVVFSVDNLSFQADNETIYAALILIFVYVLIIFELVHRTLAAMLGALAALAVLATLNQRPTMEEIVAWIEIETLMLLFGMMIIVAIISDTGVFDYCALMAYKLAKGKVWPLLTLLCMFSAFVSAFLDNVTTILLLAPVTIRLCDVLNLDPRVILIAEVLFSNIGGTATAIGDPPNVIIVGALESDGITFTVFTGHLVIGILFVTVAAYGFLRLYYRSMRHLSNPDPPEITELNHEIEMWRRAASRLVVVTREETLMKALFLQKAVELENHHNKILHRKMKAERRDLKEQMSQLEKDYQIRNWTLLTKCGAVLLIVLIMFFLYSFVSEIHIGLGWIAVLGAMWLLVLADVEDLESILHKVEWSTLLFFSALFILMEALAELKLMEWIGERISDVITGVGEGQRLTVAVIIIVWVSALASSFIDNIPYTTAMIPVLKQLSADPELDLPLVPLVMSLAFGACLGGNGTLIGASANVVCAGIAEQHGYTISFKQFFKVGFPMMLVTVAVASVYLLICHSAIKWNSV